MLQDICIFFVYFDSQTKIRLKRCVKNKSFVDSGLGLVSDELDNKFIFDKS